jgi:tetratricopeptide (TPR) repeat protein
MESRWASRQVTDDAAGHDRRGADGDTMKFTRREEPTTPSKFEVARALIDDGRAEDGIAALEEALASSDDPPDWALLLAGRTRLQVGDHVRAASWFERFSTIHPDRFEGSLGLAECAENAGDWVMAVERWRRLRADFGDPKGLAWRRRVQANLFRSGRLDELDVELRDEFSGSAESQRFWDVTTNSAGASDRRLRYRHALVVTYGRSGSTLLQGVLNSIDGMLIRGENGNVFSKYFEIAEQISSLRSAYPHAFTANRAWFGISSVSDETVLDGLRRSARSILLGDTVDSSTVACLGFKEIRYDELGDRLPEYLDFLQELFPECALVFNTRDLEATSRSGWWRDGDAAEVRRRLAEVTRRFEQYAQGRPNCFAIRYEDVVSKNERLRALFEFLGADYDEARVDAVLSFPHSFGPAQPEVKALFRER